MVLKTFELLAAERARMCSWKDDRVLVLSPTPTHPQDYGNRKRVFRVCTRLSSEGARITFVHYPAEAEWRNSYPCSAALAMSRTWHQFFTVAPCRDLHPFAKGDHHTIDEWWDDSIGSFLRWLFAVQPFDVFIVNYIWLSKALEFAPRGVTRILDTHDKLSGRRELLESHGIAPEFFYTTDSEEAVALGRADVVWAIKEEERISFSRMSPRPVLTMPHLDPLDTVATCYHGDHRFRVGLVGARNNINAVNLRRFLEVAVPRFRRAFAPLKLVIAGSICDLVEGAAGPFVELRGTMADLCEFYRSVDCVAIPISFSTGLKIKTGEALSAGVPVVSLAHAFEGYEATDAMHGLATFEELAEALVDLSFGPPERLEQLGAASVRAHARTAARIEATLESTRKIVRESQRTIVLAVDSRAFVPGTIFHAILESIYEYLKYLGQVTVFVVQGSADHVAGNEALVDRIGRVVVAVDLPEAGICAAALSALNVAVVDVREFFLRKRPKVLIAEAFHAAFAGQCCANTTLFARSEMLTHSGGSSRLEIPASAFRRAFLVSPRPASDVAAAQARGSLDQILGPCLCRSPESLRRKLDRGGRSGSVALLGSAETPALGLAASMAAAWRIEAQIVCASLPAQAQGGGWATKSMQAGDYITNLLDGEVRRPRFAIDLSLGQPGLQLCREILERSGVPVAVAVAGATDPRGAPESAYAPSSEIELWKVFRAFAQNPDAGKDEMFQRVQEAYYHSDAGWARIRRFCTQLFDTHDAEFA